AGFRAGGNGKAGPAGQVTRGNESAGPGMARVSSPPASKRPDTSFADGVLRAERTSRTDLLVCSVPYSQPDFQRPHPPNCAASFVNSVKKSKTLDRTGKTPTC